MPTNTTDMKKGPLVLVTQQNGVTVIPQPTPLTRLNYFDGKFLRASDLSAEQLYLRRLVDLSNQAGGPGVAYGYNLSLAAGGDTLNLGPGLAIDPQGRVLLLPQAFSIGVQDLIDKSRQLKSTTAIPVKNGSFADCTVVAETPPGGVVQAGNLYLITIGFAEALCGTEDVFGKLCEEACATSTDRPFLVEGVVLRVVPLQLQTPPPTSSAVMALSQLHLRSRVASSYFEDERKKVASFISGDGLRSDVWCFGAEAAGGFDVPIGVIARAGNTTLFLDAWIARRERIDTPAKRYWQWRMAMRPWDVFLAQILQFQCQLSGLFKQQPQAGGGGDDPCASAHTIIREASDTVAKIANFYQAVTTRFMLQPLLLSSSASVEQPPVLEGGLTALVDFQKRLQAVSAAALVPSDKFLIDGGIIELPSAGYLPVTPNSVISVNEQVRRLLGKGLDLRFCIVRPDFVAHALEEAQHMERISLLEGLDHPDRKPEVDILVPNGVAIEQKPVAGAAYEAELRVGDPSTGAISSGVDNRPILLGAAHIEVSQSGEVQVFTAVDFDESHQVPGVQPILPAMMFGRFVSDRPIEASPIAAVEPGQLNSLSFWGTVRCSLNPFTAQTRGQTLLEIRAVFRRISGGTVSEDDTQDLLMNGTVTFEDPVITDAERVVNGRFSGAFSIVSKVGTKPAETTIDIARLSLEVTAILFTPEGHASSLQLTFFNPAAKLAVEISASWSGSPRKIIFALKDTFGEAQTPQMLFDSTFLQNDEVLLPANKLHAAALKALNKLGTGLGDPQFEPKSAALLFPPPPPSVKDLQIRATLDWVLFHRRRTKQCQLEKTAVMIPARRYQLWHGLVANQDFLDKTIAALHNKGPFDREGVAFQRVDVVEFAPGVPTLISRRDDVQKDWKNVKPGNKLLYGAIASRDAAKQDGDDLAKGRLGEVEQAVASVSPPAPSKPLPEVLDDIHPDLAVPDVDGIIVMLTMQQTCVQVYNVAVETGLVLFPPLGFLLQIIQSGNQDDIKTAIQAQAQLMGQVNFQGTTTTFADNSATDLANTLQDLNLTVGELAIWAKATDPELATRQQQAKAIQTALRDRVSADASLTLVTSQADVLPPCPAILFLATQAVVTKNELLIVAARGESDHSIRQDAAKTTVTFKNTIPQDAALQSFVNSLVGNFNGLTLASATTVDSGASARLQVVFDALVTAEHLKINAGKAIETLSSNDRKALSDNNFSLTGIDDVIFLEFVL